MIVFHSDLDNTLIYSYKREIGADKVCVELYQDREISFMTGQSYGLLKQAVSKVLFVPTTTRTVEQYRRIALGIGVPEYALVCNGGVLLVDGEEDRNWYENSKALVMDCQAELQKAEKLLSEDGNINFEIRNIRELFLFTKSAKPDRTVHRLQARLNLLLVDVFSNGVKVYVVPKKLSKGAALRRFRQKVQADRVIAAGDSAFDISMLEEADTGFAPASLADSVRKKEGVIYMGQKNLFSDELLTSLLQMEAVKVTGNNS